VFFLRSDFFSFFFFFFGQFFPPYSIRGSPTSPTGQLFPPFHYLCCILSGSKASNSWSQFRLFSFCSNQFLSFNPVHHFLSLFRLFFLLPFRSAPPPSFFAITFVVLNGSSLSAIGSGVFPPLFFLFAVAGLLRFGPFSVPRPSVQLFRSAGACCFFFARFFRVCRLKPRFSSLALTGRFVFFFFAPMFFLTFLPRLFGKSSALLSVPMGAAQFFWSFDHPNSLFFRGHVAVQPLWCAGLFALVTRP